MKTLTRERAKSSGYEALTHGFRLPTEQGIFDRTVANLAKNSRIDYAFVPGRHGLEIWRRGYRKETTYREPMGKIVR